MPRFNTDYTSPSTVQPLEFKSMDAPNFHSRCDELQDLWPSSERGLLGNRSHVFTLNDKNEFEAVGRSTSHYDLLRQANRGCLFAVDENNQMRQIGVTKSNKTGLDINVSKPLTATDPKAPSFLTYLFSWLIPSFGAEVKAYKEQIAFNEKLRAFAKDERHPVNLNPNAEQLPLKDIVPEEVAEPTEEAPEQLEVKKDPKDMTPAEFEQHLHLASTLGSNTNIVNVIEHEDFSPEKYYEAVANIMEGQVAKEMLAYLKDNTNSDAFLNEQKMIYTPLIADLQSFVAENTDKTILERYCSGNGRQTDDANYLKETAAYFSKEGVSKYLEITNKKNAENKQQMQQEEPDVQVVKQAENGMIPR